MTGVARLVAGHDWAGIAEALDADGWATLPALLDAETCDSVASLYDEDRLFRSRIDMARHGFGQGEYRYFAYKLPAIVEALRTSLYEPLFPIANRWHERMGFDTRFPDSHAAYVARCHAAGQRRPTPLLLRYGPGDHNCVHQDLYGAEVFPIQAAVLLSAPGSEFEGGAFVMTEQRPRMQSRASVVPLAKGDAVLFAVNARPRRGAKGDYRVGMRHGVSSVRAGRRHTLGIIFHDAT